MSATAKEFAEVYRRFTAPLSKRVDCGSKCAPHNGGIPFCCDVDNAIPLVDKGEFQLLKSRTDMWTRLRPSTPSQRKEVKDLESSDSCAVKCKGVAHCERDNRSLACRAFPYFPYFDAEKNLVGLAHYWGFEGQCWVIHNPEVVDKKFVKEMIDSHEYLFLKDPDWAETFAENSASMRRVYSRRNKKFLILHRDGNQYWVLPYSGGKMVLAKTADVDKLKKGYPDAPATT